MPGCTPNRLQDQTRQREWTFVFPSFGSYPARLSASRYYIIVAKNIIKYCIDESFRFNLRPLKPLSHPRGPTGREAQLR